MTRLQILGLCGFAGSGKDTAADLLVTHAGFRKLAFGDALKAELCEAFAVAPDTFTVRERKATPLDALAFRRCTDPAYVAHALAHVAAGRLVNVGDELAAPRSPRQTMQFWGTQYRRAQNPDYWVRQVRSTIGYHVRELGARRWVLTDCRFANEVAMVRALGGQLWQIRRPGVDAGTSLEGQHASATDGGEFRPEAIIHNSHEIRHLQQLVLSDFYALDAGLPGLKVELTAP
jgi:hypothetical protein